MNSNARFKNSWLRLNGEFNEDNELFIEPTEKALNIRITLDGEKKSSQIYRSSFFNTGAASTTQPVAGEMKKDLFEKIDMEIRRLSRTPNHETMDYLSFGISNYENAKIMVKEMHAIDIVLNQYKGILSAEDLSYLKDVFEQRVVAAGVFRRKGVHTEYSDVDRFGLLDTMFSESPYQDTFYAELHRYSDTLTSFKHFKAVEPRVDYLDQIDLLFQAEYMYNLRYNEEFKKYCVDNHLSVDQLKEQWIKENFRELAASLEEVSPQGPELRAELEPQKVEVATQAMPQIQVPQQDAKPLAPQVPQQTTLAQWEEKAKENATASMTLEDNDDSIYANLSPYKKRKVKDLMSKYPSLFPRAIANSQNTKKNDAPER